MEPEEVDKAFSAASSATCVLNPCPSWLIKVVREGTQDWISVVVNSYLNDSVVPPVLKEVVVHPFLKGQLLNPTKLDSFCPVSNLPFLGKLAEKVWQLQRILDEVDYLDPFQLGFRPESGLWG